MTAQQQCWQWQLLVQPQLILVIMLNLDWKTSHLLQLWHPTRKFTPGFWIGKMSIGWYWKLIDNDIFSLSLYRCWASKDAKATTAGEETLTGADTALVSNDGNYHLVTLIFKEFEFWDEFCPKYNWVAPESGATTGSGYLKTHWDRATSLHAINFRNFSKWPVTEFFNA